MSALLSESPPLSDESRKPSPNQQALNQQALNQQPPNQPPNQPPSQPPNQPPNPAAAAGPQQRKRAHKACLNCRRRKAKCELDPSSDTAAVIVCKRCKDEGVPCEIPTIERRGGFGNVLAGKERRRMQNLLNSRSSDSVAGLDAQQASAAARLPAGWAPRPAMKGSRSFSVSVADVSPNSLSEALLLDAANLNLDSAARPAEMASEMSELGAAMIPGITPGITPDMTPDLAGSMAGSMASSMAGSMAGSMTPNMGTAAGRGSASAPTLASGFSSKAFTDRRRSRAELDDVDPATLITGAVAAHNEAQRYLAQAQIVQDGVLDAEDIPDLVAFFFSHMAPFFHQFIPREYHDLRRLVREPAFLAVICTIAAKARQQEFYMEQHQRLWTYCKQVVGSFMWECPDDQVQSLVYAVILLSEWLPGAMFIDSGKHITGVEAIRRYTRICWPLLGQAVRVARYVGILESDVQAFITLHLCDNLLACRLGCQPMLANLFEGSSPAPRAASIADRARMDILKLVHLKNRMLHGATPMRELVASGQYLPLFHMMNAHLEQWQSEYGQFMRCATFHDKVIMFEYHHIPLHTFSLAIVPWQEKQVQDRLRSKSGPQLSPSYQNTMGLEDSRKYVELASESARFIVEHIEDPSNPVNLRYAPIQWIMRLLYAGVFLAKTLLVTSLHPTKERQKTTIRVIRKAVGVMRASYPQKFDPYCDLLDAICAHVVNGEPSAAHIAELERLHDEYKAQQYKAQRQATKPASSTSSASPVDVLGKPPGGPPGGYPPFASPESGPRSGQRYTTTIDEAQAAAEVPVTHEIPSDKPFKSRRLDHYSPPLSPTKPEWALEAGPAEPDIDSEPETAQDYGKHDIASLEFASNTIDEMENIWDFLGDSNLVDLGLAQEGVSSLSL